ncbi:Gephyrin [Escovopsis weberi]|uniref:Gephyrin n=1 Tax=Escovopsis weberi TaxID=150374 RepID=A0A0M9VW08_ESCWE|nr:Gephyrin [Escovopsis weberi]
MDRPLTAAILIVSTTAAKVPSTDASASILRDVLDKDGCGKWKVVEQKIVTDSVADIRDQVTAWTDGPSPVNLVLTTGGTGFSVADVTPEAVAPLIQKSAPGLVHAMLSLSLSITPFAMMSRPTAGVRNKSLVITLPGSPKGAKENLQAVIKTLPHACLQILGENSRALHEGGLKKLESDAGFHTSDSSQSPAASHHHHHHHHHHAHDRGQKTSPGHSHSHGHGHGHGALQRFAAPRADSVLLSNDVELGPTRRHRESPFPMVSVDDALALIAQFTPKPQACIMRVNKKLVGSVLAEDVRAKEDVPAFRASIVDGYAVVVPEDGVVDGVFPVTGISHAAPGHIGTLKEGEIARITTGAPLPPGATAVIMVEDTVLRSMSEDGAEEKEVEIQAEGVTEGANIREVGSDIAKGSVILSKGERISGVGGEMGLLAAVGIAETLVYRRPVVGILSTGDEIVEHNRAGPLQLGEVRDTNRLTLISAAREWGFQVVDLGIAKDAPGTLELTLRNGLRAVDVLITTGGVSMGELDLLKPTVERSLGGTIHFGRVAMKPGKPTTFATVPVKDNAGNRISKVVFSLPGNPASALVTFHLFVLPALHRHSGISPVGLPKVPVVLAHEVSLDSRPEYHRAVVSVGDGGLLMASSTGGQRSSKVGSLRSANALLCLPSGNGKLEKGARVDALLIDTIRAATAS